MIIKQHLGMALCHIVICGSSHLTANQRTEDLL